MTTLPTGRGHAAKVYFNALFGMDFSRTANNSINAALNYGYGIIVVGFQPRNCFKRLLNTDRYISHSNMFNQFNLSSDLMEPFQADYRSEELKRCLLKSLKA